MLIYNNGANYCVTCVQHMFTIDPREEASIYRAWKTRASKWLHNMFHNIHENDANTNWLIEDILRALRAY